MFFQGVRASQVMCIKFYIVHRIGQKFPDNDTRSELERCLAEAKSASRGRNEDLQSKQHKIMSIVGTTFKANKAGSSGGGVYALVS